jgi:hypothetical protein
MKYCCSLPLLTLGLLILIGCTNETRDTEGRDFTFECRTGECLLTKVEKTGDAPAAPTHLPDKDGRILTVCSQEATDFSCRPLVCDDSTACSSLGGGEFLCSKGLCQATERDLTAADRLALCLAGTGEWKRTPEQLRQLTLARGCMGDCFLPAACRKP